MMIKEGQIYSHTHIGKNIVICITRVRKNGNPYIITNNGTSGTRDSDDFEKYTLIAEYPTWQQAVNSKEFKNIDCGKAGFETSREIELEKKLEIAVKALKSAFGGFKTIQHAAAYPDTNFNCHANFDALFSGAIEKCAEMEQALKEIEE